MSQALECQLAAPAGVLASGLAAPQASWYGRTVPSASCSDREVGVHIAVGHPQSGVQGCRQ